VSTGEHQAGRGGVGLIVGLGNIGAEYERTRHNAGFWFVDRLARRAGASFRNERKFRAAVAMARLGGREAWLAKPSTFMNLSGQAVVALAGFYRILPDRILVVHDEIDLEPGDVRLKLGGGCAGHNGLKSIRDHLSTADFWRLRLGVGHPRTRGLVQEVADYVLHPPRREEEAAIEQSIERADAVVELLLEGEFDRARIALAPPPAPRPAREPRAPRPPEPQGEP
jgi:PTH1 family peptidyl-tRNA hydrolase